MIRRRSYNTDGGVFGKKKDTCGGSCSAAPATHKIHSPKKPIGKNHGHGKTCLWQRSGRPHLRYCPRAGPFDRPLARKDRTDPDFHKARSLGRDSVLGTFVSFKKNDQLRSCMGWMSDGVSWPALKASATSATREDPRFPLGGLEFESLSMEVWVLWGMEETTVAPEERINAFQIGRHGLQISGGGRRGLLRPGSRPSLGWGRRSFWKRSAIRRGFRDAWRDELHALHL